MISIGLVFLLFLGGDNLDHNELLQIRELHYKAAINEEDCENLVNYLKKYDDSENSTIHGYQGVSFMFLAKYGWNPFSKLANFNEGSKILDEAIESDLENVELRFLRLSVQKKVPSVLDYSDNIEEDKKLILASWSALKDEDLKKRIQNYMLKEAELTTKEKEIFFS